ncbi:aminotransferase class I/II-fold pyridoxal phosphate-dependent enzyme [Cytobacillus depressus]|uniref:Aminotransferase n=1 Tax=Cytobacillus depressus TaxID=1602942 RepID=A0A6L3V5B8_9BACI|nr:aminotransferase class I/II-fold pyridoxal phosphate-dependent enzyme [Cytobacillus depressus]KAB2329549.1 aminotransferase class I/II-fold pyridoxal phosphate-dependent enzyme [Cytobacillus depressus]
MKNISETRSSLPRSGIREIMDVSANIPDVIHLEVGEPNVNTPIHIREAAYAAMNEGFTHYTANAGLLSLRESIATHLLKQYDLQVKSDQIVVAAGAVNALAATVLTLVESGEEVLIPDPGWPNYEQIILSQEAIPKRYKLNPELGFVPDMADLEQVVTPNTKAIIINSPGNPTGGVLNEENIKEIIDFAERHDLYVISDEVYDGIVFEGEHLCPMSYDSEGRVISIFGFSKNYAMTGWRVGYAVAPQQIAPIIAKVLEPLISCASSVSQKAAEAAISSSQDFVDEMRDIYKGRRDQAYKLLEEAGIKAYKPKGAFYMMIDLSDVRTNEENLALALLKDSGVAVAPGATFGSSTKQMIRISLATEDSKLLEGVKRICNFVRTNREKVNQGGASRCF